MVTDENSEQPTGVSVPVSSAAQTLLDSGVKPFVPDVEQMMAQMIALQNRIAAMEAEKGIPSDPVAAGVSNLQAHVAAKVNASPLSDLTELSKEVVKLVEHPARETVSLIRELVGRAIRRYPHLDLAYVDELASDLHVAVLKNQPA